MESFKETVGYYVTISQSLIENQTKLFNFLVNISIPEFMEDTFVVSVVPVEDEKFPESTQCIQVQIYEEFEEDEEGDDIEGTGKVLGYINTLNYNQMCSMGRPLREKEGRAMVMPILEFCQKMFGATLFYLQDTSRFACNSETKNVWLQEHNMLVHGMSWYERTFGAKPKTEDDVQLLQETKQVLQTIVSIDKSEMIIEEMRRNFARKMEKTLFREFKKIIRESVGIQTWNQMFKRINLVRMDHTDINEGTGCEFFQDYIINKLYSRGGNGILGIVRIDEWVIELDTDTDGELLDYAKI